MEIETMQQQVTQFASAIHSGKIDVANDPYSEVLVIGIEQLVMESLGKELDRNGKVVNQGIAVYGNMGSTDQHAYVQQLRDGMNNFFVTFIRVLRDADGDPVFEEPNVTSGDYLDGFLLGTRRALFEKDCQSITITIREVSPFTVGVLVALYQRAVGLYASMINLNACNQPGVEGGKKAASDVLGLQTRVLASLRSNGEAALTAQRIAESIGMGDDTESVFHVLEHLSANARVKAELGGASNFETKYRIT